MVQTTNTTPISRQQLDGFSGKSRKIRLIVLLVLSLLILPFLYNIFVEIRTKSVIKDQHEENIKLLAGLSPVIQVADVECHDGGSIIGIHKGGRQSPTCTGRYSGSWQASTSYEDSKEIDAKLLESLKSRGWRKSRVGYKKIFWLRSECTLNFNVMVPDYNDTSTSYGYLLVCNGVGVDTIVSIL